MMIDILKLVEFIIVILSQLKFFNSFFQMHLKLCTGRHLLITNIFSQGK